MDNLGIFLLVNVVLALIVSIFGNFATGWVKSAYDKSVFSSNRRRIESLIEEYKQIEAYSENYQYLIVASIRQLAYGIIVLFISVLGTLLSSILGINDKSFVPKMFFNLYSIGVLVAVYIVYYTVIIPIRKSLRFARYKEKVIAKLIKLGGNPEDLDKEEAVG